jgi:hypothetical protein
MSKEQKKILLILVLAAVFAYFWWTREREKAMVFAPGEGAKMLVNRMWVDHLPTSPREKYSGYFFAVRGLGIHDSAESIFKHLVELFHFKIDGTTMNFQFPHDDRSASSSFTVEKLKDVRGPLDLKLTVQNDPQRGGETGVYYSSTRWRKGDNIDMRDGAIQALIPPGVVR